MTNTNTNITENLKRLLVELQKVKDLNNLSNEYKAISADLILSLSDFLKDSKAFSSSFNQYLEQTNKSVIDTKELLNNTIQTIENTNNRISSEENRIFINGEKILDGLQRLEEQYSQVCSLYDKCLWLENKIENELTDSINDAANKLERSTRELIPQMEHYIDRFKQEIIERESQADDHLTTVINRIGDVDRLVTEQSNETNEKLIQLQQQNLSIEEERKKTLTFIDSTKKDVVSQINASLSKQSSLIKSHESTMQRSTSKILNGMDDIQAFQKIGLGMLVINLVISIVLLVIYLIFK